MPGSKNRHAVHLSKKSFWSCIMRAPPALQRQHPGSAYFFSAGRPAPPPPQPLAFLCFPSPSALKKKLLLCGCQRALNRCHICGGTVSAPFMRWICSSAFGFHGFLDLQIRVQSHLLIALQLLNSKIGVEWAAHPVQATWQLQRKSNSR